jgi:hypothetical protein
MKINYRKSIKLITLLASALLIATVSAATYSYMYIKGSGSITTGGLSWETGSDAPLGTTVAGAYVTDMNFSISVNQFLNATDSLHLINGDATSHTFGIEATATGGDTSKFTTFDMVIYKSDQTGVARISVKNNETASSLTIQGSETLYIRFEIDPLLDETSGDMAFTLKLTYEV